ncbi:MAG: hypothetical protein ACYC7D_14420 [Nitrososphaerales archaeon]
MLDLPEKDPVAEAARILAKADGKTITLRLLGGIAFRLRSPSTLSANLQRRYVDIDLVGLRNQRKEITHLFNELGYTPRTTFNAMNGLTRLIFNDMENERRVDIFLNVFEMCHKLDFTSRLKLDSVTLPLADLLLTKLQVYEITEREYKDVSALLKDHDLGDSDDPDTINSKYIAKLCSENWGLWKTVSLNLERISNALPTYLPSSDDQKPIREKITLIKQKINAAPKSLGWKLRAKVGEKVKWYELPEADREVVDSRPAAERISK